jgi:iron only hydrogenase large subunit-like protein
MMGAFRILEERKGWSDDDAFYDIDYVLTTRELARMFKDRACDLPRCLPRNSIVRSVNLQVRRSFSVQRAV